MAPLESERTGDDEAHRLCTVVTDVNGRSQVLLFRQRGHGQAGAVGTDPRAGGDAPQWVEQNTKPL
jgi:hypothetical protein